MWTDPLGGDILTDRNAPGPPNLIATIFLIGYPPLRRDRLGSRRPRMKNNSYGQYLFSVLEYDERG